jgi:subtilisin-like proprotein convertase family protein
MKKLLLLGIFTASTLLSAQGALYALGNVNGSGTSLNQTIYDANPSGITSSLVVSGAGSSLSAITVTLNIAGGYNGDLYGYLSYNGTLVTLLNRVGTGSGSAIQNTFGFSTAGFSNVTLDDAATGGNIHNVQNPGSLPTVSYTADGGSLASFNGMDPNGTWTLFFADLSAGNTSTLNGWSLDVTAVPEPVNVALAIFGVGLIGMAARRTYQGSKNPAR